MIFDPGVIKVRCSVAIDEGLVVPGIKNADKLGLAEMADLT